MIVVVILFFQSICLYLQKIVLNIYDNWLYPQHHRLHVPTATKEQIDQQSSSSTSLQYQSNKTNNNNISQYSTYTIYSRDVINSCRFCTNSPIGLCRHHSNPHHPKKGSGKHICRCIKCLQQQQNGKTFLQRLLNWNQTPKITNHKLTIRKSSSSINNNNINKNNIQEQNNKNSLNNNNNINYSQNDDQYYDENLNNYPTGRINTSLNFNNSNSICSRLSKSSGTRAIIYGYDRTDDGVVYMNGEEISRSGKRLRKIRQRI